MTLREARELIQDWKEFPPTFVLVKALVEGFGGKPKDTLQADEIVNQDTILTKIARSTGSALPVIRRPDLELEKMPLVVDFEEMRRRNVGRARGLKIVHKDDLKAGQPRR